jgi:hypothetical protein
MRCANFHILLLSLVSALRRVGANICRTKTSSPEQSSRLPAGPHLQMQWIRHRSSRPIRPSVGLLRAHAILRRRAVPVRSVLRPDGARRRTMKSARRERRRYSQSAMITRRYCSLGPGIESASEMIACSPANPHSAGRRVVGRSERRDSSFIPCSPFTSYRVPKRL